MSGSLLFTPVHVCAIRNHAAMRCIPCATAHGVFLSEIARFVRAAEQSNPTGDLLNRVVVIGAGHMGTAMIAGLHDADPGLSLAVVENADGRRRALREEFGIETVDRYSARPGDVVILAVQPQQFEALAARDRRQFAGDALVVSVMAGVSIPAMTGALGTGRVVRAIPNTPSEVLEGMTVICPAPDVTADELTVAERVLTSIGRVVSVSDEELIDDATALCGGGPAFVSHIASAFIGFAVERGFPADQARMMTCQVLRGTAQLIASTDRDTEELCRQVMTPGGTTEQGIFHYREYGLRKILADGLAKSALRSRELGGIGRQQNFDGVR